MSRTIDPLLEALARRDRIELAAVADELARSQGAWAPSLASLIELSGRLPSGLVHAQAIWALAAPPPDLTALGPGSAWYAMDRALVVVLPPGGAALQQLLLDLGRYRLFADALRVALEGREDLFQALDQPVLEPLVSTELAVILQAEPAAVANLDRMAPGLRADLAWLARDTFDPPVHVHSDLRPERLEAFGKELAEGLLARLPARPFQLVVSDGRLILELLSPYARDLGHALYAWGRQNAERISVHGVLEAIEAGPDAPHADVAALVAADLLRGEPDVLAERREAEATQGLYLADARGMTYGFAELGALAAPDPAVVEGRGQVLVVLAGGAPEAQRAAVGSLLASGRVAGLAAIFSVAMEGTGPLLPAAIVTEEDGHAMDGSDALLEVAEGLGIAARTVGPVAVDRSRGVPAVLSALLSAARRARAVGTLEGSSTVHAVLYPRPGAGVAPPLAQRATELDAGRIALAGLFQDRTKTPKRPKVQGQAAPTRRFRA